MSEDASGLKVSLTRRPSVTRAEELIGLYFPMLDHGFIGLCDYMGSDDAIEAAARGSYAYGVRAKTDQRKLLRYMMRHRHTSPFERVEVVVHAAMPITVARQWIRHRTASVNEMSGRYSLMPMLFYMPDEAHVQHQSRSNKQGREGELPPESVEEWQDRLRFQRRHVQDNYRWATENDIARELARIDLPGSVYTRWIWKIDLHNLLHALSLRCHEHAQWETRQYFNWLAGLAKRLAPVSFEAWEDYHFHARTFSRQEMALLRRLLVVDEGCVDARQDECSESVRVYDDEMKRAGLGKRERAEFLAKFDESAEADFDLDLSQAKLGRYFEDKFRAAAEG